jgi:penicillin-insensitive murein endopeptidase
MIVQKKSARFLRRALRFFGVLLGLFLLVLLARPLFGEALDSSRYTATDAEKYYALPVSGPNFRTNSRIAYGVGRHFLKGKAVAAVLAAYGELAKTHPQYSYVYGEMGWKGGGRIRPHRTHQEGLSADFMTPMLKIGPDGKALPALLPCNPLNLFGYNIRLDDKGQFKKLRLDSKAMIAHLAALRKAAPHYGLRVKLVIFDPPLLKILRADPNFSQLRGISFMEKKAWFPHDGHYHVDFAAK